MNKKLNILNNTRGVLRHIISYSSKTIFELWPHPYVFFTNTYQWWRKVKKFGPLTLPVSASLHTLRTMDHQWCPRAKPLERPRGFFSVGAFHLERPLKYQFTASEGSFQLKYSHRSCKDPSWSFRVVFPTTSLTAHSVCLREPWEITSFNFYWPRSWLVLQIAFF